VDVEYEKLPFFAPLIMLLVIHWINGVQLHNLIKIYRWRKD